jgi:peptidyl-prolyl cis-trans isomerase D
MLQFIRDRAQGLIAWFIVFLIVIPFAMWGINDYVSGGKEKPAAEVNGTKISKQELLTAYQQQRQRLEQMLGPNFNPEMFAEGPMKKAILDQLIERELAAQSARAAGLRVSDATVADLIRSVPAFQTADGKFSQEAYERALRRQGMTPETFETEVRRDIVSGQWRSALQQSAFVTPAEAAQFVRLQKQARDFGYLTFPVAKFESGVQVSDADVQKFYDENKARFTTPEQVRVAYVELAAADVAGDVPVSDDDVRAYYEAHKDEFTEPEQRRASHILFLVPEGSKPEADQAARKQAEETLKRLRAGESFAALAKQLSQDPGTKAKGGDLGYFGRGVMDKAFEASVFSLKKGEVSEPVRSAFGYHIIKLDDVKGGAAKSFESMRDPIRQRLRADKAQERFYTAAEKLNNLAYEHPESLQTVSDELKLPIRHTDYFTRGGGQGMAADPKFAQAAFSEDVLEKGNNSDAIELTRDHLVVLRVEDRKPEAQRPLGEVRGQIVAQLRNEKAKAAAREAADKALAAIKGSTDPVAAGKTAGGNWQMAKGVVRTDAKVARPLVQTAFRLPRPGKGPSADRVTLPTGDEAVVVLQAVQEGAAPAPGEQPQAQAGALARADAEAAYQGAIATMRKAAKVEINEDQL